jgi:hypothetical protein
MSKFHWTSFKNECFLSWRPTIGRLLARRWNAWGLPISLIGRLRACPAGSGSVSTVRGLALDDGAGSGHRPG